MAVLGTLSKTLGGSNVSDSLSGSSTGYDFGIATTSTITTPVNPIYFKHNGVNSITACSYYIASYTGIYGGDYSAAVDYAKVLAHGDSGLGGLQFEESFSNGTPFNGSYFQVNTANGSSYATKRSIQTSSILYNNSGTETTPSSPVSGTIGASPNSTLGDNVKLRARYVIPTTESLGGRRQISIVFTFNFTT